MKTLIRNTKIITSGYENPISGDIAIEGEHIKHVGCVPDYFAADKVIDGSRFIAMPGLVNAHTHSPMGLFRNLADDLPFAEWLFENIIPAENKLTPDDVYWGSLLGIAEMLKSGVTCFADMYLHMDSIAQAVLETGIRANLSYGPITSETRGNGLIVDEKTCEAFIKKWNNAQGGKIKTSVEIHSVYLFDQASIKEAAAFAKRIGAGIHIHLSESVDEISMCNEKYGLSPVAAAFELGIFEVPTISAHCVQLSKADIELLSKNDVYPVHCPSSNLKLGNGCAPVPLLIQYGIPVCLGTDGSASNNNLNMFEEMHIAALIHKSTNRLSECMPSSEIINMATANGSKALGFDGSGTLEEGKLADIVLINTDKPHLCPVNNPKSAVVYSAQAGDVDTVFVNGEVLVSGGKLLKMDEELIMSKAREISGRISGRG